jgi:hypothetical protein
VREKGGKSEEFRRLYRSGMSVSDISKKMGECYSFVYGVVSKEEGFVKKEGVESKGSVIRRMWDEGKTVGEIARLLLSNYSYVWGVVDRHRKSKK